MIGVAEKIGADLPQTKVVNSLDALVKAVEEIGLPVMVKGSLYKAYRAYTMPEAVNHFHNLVAEWGYPIIVQQVVSGDELNVVGVGDGQGESLGLVGVKKICVTALGKIWTGVTVRNEPMLQAAKEFIRQFKWHGPFELECILGQNKLYLIEVNPRFPAWVYLAKGVGVNLPARLVRRSHGLPVEPLENYEAGKLFIRYSYDLVTDMNSFQKAITRGETP